MDRVEVDDVGVLGLDIGDVDGLDWIDRGIGGCTHIE